MSDLLTVPPGLEAEEKYKQLGFSQDEILEVRKENIEKYRAAGFSDTDINAIYGFKEPDTTALQVRVKEGLVNAPKTKQVPDAMETLPGQPPAVAEKSSPPTSKDEEHKPVSLLDAYEAGFSNTAIGILKNQKLPEKGLPENAGIGANAAYQIGALTGDLPLMLAGGAAGIAGGPVGIGSAASALPAMMRSTLVQMYEKGEVKDFRDFWDRASSVAIETSKAAAVGGVTMGVGGNVAKALAKTATPAIAQTSARLFSEATTMATLGPALEGHLPKFDDFVNSYLVMGGLHATVAGVTKTMRTFSKTGITPIQVAEHAAHDPIIAQEMMSDSPDPPKAYSEIGQKSGRNFKAEVEALDAQIEKAKNLPETPETKSQYEKLINDRDSVTNQWIDENRTVVEVSEETKAPFDGNKFTDTESVQLEKKPTLDELIVTGEKPPESIPVKDAFKQAVNEAYTDWVDDLHPLRVVEKAINGGKKLNINDASQIARLNQTIDSKIAGTIKFGFRDFETGTKQISKGWDEIISKIDDPAALDKYMVADRALKLEAAGKKSGVDLTEASKVVKEGKKKYSPILEEAVKFRNAGLEILKDSGIVSEETYKSVINSEENTVPFRREMDNGKSGGSNGPQKPIHQYKGSDRNIIQPMRSMITEAANRLKMAEHNRAIGALVKLGEQEAELVKSKGLDPESAIIKKVSRGVNITEVSPEEIAAHFEKQGIPIGNEILDVLSKDMKVARPKPINLRDNEFLYFRNGKPEIWSIESEDAAKVIKAFNQTPQAMDLITKIMNYPKVTLTAGAILNPEFAIKNPFSDALSAFAFEGAIPGPTQLKGLAAVTAGKILPALEKTKFGELTHIKALSELMGGSKKLYQDWLTSGGSLDEFDLKKYIDQDVYKINETTGILDKTKNVIATPMQALKAITTVSDEMTRLGVYDRAIKKGKTPAEGSLISRDASIDFARGGTKAEVMNKFIVFFKVGISSTDKLARAIKEDPVGVGARSAAFALASAALYAVTRGDKRLDDLPRYEKDLFWNVPTDKWENISENLALKIPENQRHILRQGPDGAWQINNGAILKFKKPHFLGIAFGSTTERVLSKFFDANPRAFKDFQSTIFSAFATNTIPVAATPILEQMSNHSFFSGHNIIPAPLEKASPELQFTPYTSETSKQLGKMIGYVAGKDANISSPLVIDNYIRAWTGGLGKHATNIIDAAIIKAGGDRIPPKPASSLADDPFVKGYVVRYPSANSQAVQDFFDRYEKTITFEKDAALLQKRGDRAGMIALYNDPENQVNLLKMKGIKDAISAQMGAMDMIRRDMTMTPNDKAQLLNVMTFQMMGAAKAGMEAYDSIDRKVNKK